MSDKTCLFGYETPKKETFFFSRPDSEVFAVELDGKPRIQGYAAMYSRFSEDLGGFRTVVAPNAFDRIMHTADVRFLVNHDPNLILGRTKSGTLKIYSDAKGLGFDADPPDTAMAQHYMTAIRRGDMDGCSFTCTVAIDQWDLSGETPVRTLVQIGELYDVGPVTFPAFPDTSVATHSLQLARFAMQQKSHRSLDVMKLKLELAR